MNSQASSSRWSLDYTRPSQTSARDPPGYLSVASQTSTSNAQALLVPTADLTKIREHKAWEVAMAPAKNVPMQAFMMYMTGGGVQIFSVMSVWFLLKGAVVGMMSVNKTFAPFTSSISPSSSDSSSTRATSTPALLLPKLTFLACQIALLAVGLWKVNSMGLLPTHASDWLAFQDRIVWEGRSVISEGLGSGLPVLDFSG